MKTGKIGDMYKGWFIGNFEPSLCKTNDVEVALKHYAKGDREEAHYHKIATEFTVVVSGRIRMFSREWGKGDIIVVEPYDCTDFEALEDSDTLVVKHPGASNDKYLEVGND